MNPTLVLVSLIAMSAGAARAAGEGHVVRTMTIELDAGADRAFPLFGPVREREWSPEWSPNFIAPPGGSQSREGAVFTTGAG